MCDGCGEGGAKVDGGRWMYVGSRVYCILVFRICVYECVYDVVCLYIGVLMCMHMSAYVCGGADLSWMMGFEIMVVSGCRPYVTEPVDVVLVVTGRVLYVVGGPLHVCTVLWWWFVLGGIIYDSVDGSG